MDWRKAKPAQALPPLVPPAWWSEHVRPRDVYALLALLLLASLSALVWTTGEGDAAARKDVIVYALGIVAGIGGYYSGARVADRATERAAEKDEALSEATALVAAFRAKLETLSETSKEDPNVEMLKETEGRIP